MMMDSFTAIEPKGLENVDQIAALAREAAESHDPSKFYKALRDSEIPYLLERYRDDPRGLFTSTLAGAHKIGTSSPALALGVSQHLASMWAFGLAQEVLATDEALSGVVNRLLTEVSDRRLLIANTTSHAGGRTVGAFGSSMRRVDGRLIVDGWSEYMSLASEADKITFLTPLAEGGLVGVVGDLGADPGIRVSDDLLFGDHLALADTRRVYFDHLEVPETSVIGPDERLIVFYNLQLLAQTLCVAALYLGGAWRILEETKLFGRGTTLPTGAQLSTSEAFSADVGRLVLLYSTSVQLVLSMADPVEALHRQASPGNVDAGEVLRQATAVKYIVARNIEEIAVECRKLIGARSFMGSHPVARIGNEIVFAALGPATEKSVERTAGARYLEA